MSNPTNQLIDEQITELKRLAPIIPPRTAWGDSNLEAIEAQIEVLEKRLTPAAVDDRRNFEGEEESDSKWTVYAGDCAADVARWLRGEEGELPSDSWSHLVP